MASLLIKSPLLWKHGTRPALAISFICFAALAAPCHATPRPPKQQLAPTYSVAAEPPLAKSLRKLLNNPHITVTVVPVTDDLYAVRLEGTLESQEAIDKAIAVVKAFYPSPIAAINSELKVTKDPSVLTEVSLKALIESLLNNPAVPGKQAEAPGLHATVKQVDAHRFVVRLYGEAANQEALDDAIDSLAPLNPSPILALNTTGIKIKTKPDRPAIETVERWRMTFLPLGVRPLDPDDKPSGALEKEDTIDKLVSALNRIYGTDKKLAVERANYSELLLRGGPETRLKIKKLLAVIDVAWPQVQTNIWAIQVSGDQAEVGRKVQDIEDQSRQTRRALSRTLGLLNRVINEQAGRFESTDDVSRNLLARMKAMGFTATAHGPLSLNEAIIFLALDPARMRAGSYKDKETIATLFSERVRKDEQLAKLCAKQDASFNEKLPEAYKGLETVFAKLPLGTLSNPDIEGIVRFVESVETFRGEGEILAKAAADATEAEKDADRLEKAAKDAPADKKRQTDAEEARKTAVAARDKADRMVQDAPARLATSSATADRLIKQAVDAFSDDTNDLFFVPLLRFAQSQGSNKSGVALIGQTRIVVTSNIEARLAGEMSSYVETTRPRPFGKELLDAAFPQVRDRSDSRETSETKKSASKISENGEATTTGPDSEKSSTQKTSDALTSKSLTGAQLVASAATPAQALALAAVLNDSVPPTFARVAPGIAVNIRPTVFPDGGSGRMVIEARFGVKTTDIGDNSKRTDVFVYPQPSAVEAHRIATDTAVSAYDLFDLSHFSVTSSTPQPPEYLPVLGRLPILGPMFQRPRANKDVHYESLLLINTVILPRSMEMARFYGGQ